MQTEFTEDQLKDPGIQRSNEILRSCVHCGFCTATCPTYQVLGDELDSPRGRIYLIKDMLENNRVPDEKTVKHIDRCLSCLACMTTCPSGVHYMHLIDHARAYIDKNYKRPFTDRALRWVLAQILPYPGRFRLALFGAKLARPFKGLVPDARLRAMLDMAPKDIPPVSRNDDPQSFTPAEPRKKRVALMTGCAQKALNTDINDATIRLLTRLGCEVVVAKGAGCCGALTHHMGREDESHATAAKNIRAWCAEIDGQGLDAIVINTSGCGTTVKDYGHMFRNDALAADAARVSERAMDISELLMQLDLPEGGDKGLTVAYHAACSLQHGQQIKTHPKTLLKRAGFKVVEPADSHLCCGSAGTYNLMQPEISGQLKERKVKTLEAKNPDLIAAGNIGCMMQIGSGTKLPIVHTVELLDWATGGPKPPAMTDGNGHAATAEDQVPILR
ncbi:2-hydroxy-acid oxidase [Phaeobacter gallaeciensis]|jgi:glycolate oxidase iron-sulfur subunit|uniref:Glycolate oxidase iron-sulfur subunit n=1 Tax=Phaeobacter gallaeciensis TaxID=60890 RepID=A0A1B0ZRK5_9RHOB|nr:MULTISPECIES: glycolate oxidase subunit GlcF [Phaeobacter]MDF1771956.1 glycolate oxidase subunit GlcF [Pseudophaeobacter sp. bin_em_oilr2.035]MEE2632905.1 glycolate oxidase subunit GlcF [Pseudomonadota bacterium]ANP36761.1 2-hydroxy-acid oxidase [Phaeobacter gallaeciensis]MDE4060443.1 glycolate oxidase subunit GlcF [Phaeobacter gallaeciensis]MDE4123462.1 glycolate oxidase subunit GlcF [Phaeobacter gallaeciensis]